MKLLFKERFFTWFDSYDVYNESGETVFTVEGQLAWGHCLKIFDPSGRELGMVKERILTFFPTFEIYEGETLLGEIRKEFSLFTPRFTVDYRGWDVDGDFFEWDYSIRDGAGQTVATVAKELFQWTDTYTIDLWNERDALHALMLVLAIDAEKCSRN